MFKSIMYMLAPSLMFAGVYDYPSLASRALANNTELKAKATDVQIAQMELDMVKSSTLGKISINHNFARTNNPMNVFGSKLSSSEATFADFGVREFLTYLEPSHSPLDALGVKPDELNNPKAINSFDTNIMYEYPVFTGFKLDNAKKMAQIAIQSSKSKYNYDKNLLLLKLNETYNNINFIKAYIKALQSGKKTTSELVKTTTHFYEQGIVVKSDLLQAKSYDEMINAQLVDANSGLSSAMSYLKYLSGVDDISDITSFSFVSNTSYNIKELVQKATTQREDLKSQKLRVEMLKTKIDYDSSEDYPTVGLVAKYGVNSNDFGSGKDYYTIGLGINYNLFDFGKTKSNKQKSSLEYAQNLEYYNVALKQTKLEIEKTVLHINSLKSSLVHKSSIKLYAQETLENTKVMYQNSLVTMATLLQKHSEYERAKVELIKNEFDLINTKMYLSLLSGENLIGEYK